MTSSARASGRGGIVRPSSLAAWRLTTSSKGCRLLGERLFEFGGACRVCVVVRRWLFRPRPPCRRLSRSFGHRLALRAGSIGASIPPLAGFPVFIARGAVLGRPSRRGYRAWDRALSPVFSGYASAKSPLSRCMRDNDARTERWVRTDRVADKPIAAWRRVLAVDSLQMQRGLMISSTEDCRRHVASGAVAARANLTKKLPEAT